jgi:hypothetical protein
MVARRVTTQNARGNSKSQTSRSSSGVLRGHCYPAKGFRFALEQLGKEITPALATFWQRLKTSCISHLERVSYVEPVTGFEPVTCCLLCG